MFEEYEWAGQRRIRASTLLVGGFAGLCNVTVIAYDLLKFVNKVRVLLFVRTVFLLCFKFKIYRIWQYLMTFYVKLAVHRALTPCFYYGRRISATSMHKNIGSKRWASEASRSATKIAQRGQQHSICWYDLYCQINLNQFGYNLYIVFNTFFYQ